MSTLSILEKRVVAAEKYGREWADLHATWLQLDEDKKSFLAAIMNDLDDGSMSEAKLERLARGSKHFREYIANMALAKGTELRAKVRYDNARDLFEAGRSAESTEREKIKHLNHIP
jgi:acyl-CoA reductase-like NAD-dependent aldehyde dehydrogenase